jgi:hypothetical protein
MFATKNYKLMKKKTFFFHTTTQQFEAKLFCFDF